MKKKLKKEVNATKCNERLILTTAIILIVVAIIYTISRYAGGAFFDFCAGAIGWVVLGIGVAFVLVYMSQKD
jgi:hypothetical protein